MPEKEDTKKTEKDGKNIVENSGFQATPDFDAEQNLIGAFSILLEWDKRVNPQNYGLKNNENYHA